MSPEEWFASDSEYDMLNFLVARNSRRRPARRKLILLVAAVGRQICSYVNDPRANRCLELAEELADGRAWCAECGALKQDVGKQRVYESLARAALCTGELSETAVLVKSALEAVGNIDWYGFSYRDESEKLIYFPGHHPSAVLRELFGNPFKVDRLQYSPVMKPGWQTDTTVSLARGMYESRDFSAMPILADALQDAGCDYNDILDHCRDPEQVHVRGCWVIDLVLGREMTEPRGRR